MFAIATQPGLVSQPYRTIAQVSGVALSTGKPGHRRSAVPWACRAEEQRRAHLSRLAEICLPVGQPLSDPPAIQTWCAALRSTTPDWWRVFDFASFDARLGGESAADILTHELKAANVTLYSRAPLGSQFLLSARLRPDPRGDVEILESFWPESLERGWTEPGRQPLVHPFLIYADLVASGDSRNLRTATQIYEQYITPALRLPKSGPCTQSPRRCFSRSRRPRISLA